VEKLEIFGGFVSKVNESGNCNLRGTGAAITEDNDSMVMVGKSGLAGVLAAETAATERTAAARAGVSARLKVEMWRVLTFNNTSRRGCPEEVIAGITKLEFWSNALNDTSNVLTAYVTMAMKANGPANRFSRLWMPKLNTQGVIIHGDADFESSFTEAEKNATMKARATMTEAQLEVESAWFWWGGVDIERRHALGIQATYKDGIGTYDPAEVLAAYLAADPRETRRGAA
jgi:hypothetical protein